MFAYLTTLLLGYIFPKRSSLPPTRRLLDRSDSLLVLEEEMVPTVHPVVTAMSTVAVMMERGRRVVHQAASSLHTVLAVVDRESNGPYDGFFCVRLCCIVVSFLL